MEFPLLDFLNWAKPDSSRQAGQYSRKELICDVCLNLISTGPVLVDGMLNSIQVEDYSKINLLKVVEDLFLFRMIFMRCANYFCRTLSNEQ